MTGIWMSLPYSQFFYKSRMGRIHLQHDNGKSNNKLSKFLCVRCSSAITIWQQQEWGGSSSGLLALHFRWLSKLGVDSFPGAGSAVGQMFDLIVSLLVPQILMSLLEGL